MTARLMKMSAVAETSFVEQTRKPAKPAAKPTTPRKRAPAKPPAPTDAVAPSEASAKPRGRRRGALLWSALIISAAGSTAAGFSSCVATARARPEPRPRLRGDADVVRRPHDGPVYWLGPMAARKLELTSTSAGTFVRYLPLSASIGDSSRAITVGTYPMLNAYATAAGRAKSTQMTSRETTGGGLAVEQDAPDERLSRISRRAAPDRGLRAGRRQGSHARPFGPDSPCC